MCNAARVEVSGIWTAHYRGETIAQQASQKGLTYTEVNAHNPCLEIVVADLPCALRKQDRVARWSNTCVYEATNIESNGHGIASLVIVELE